MRSPLRLLALTLVVTLAAVGSAQAVMQDLPEFTLAPFTKAQKGAGTAVTGTLVWKPTLFLSPGPGSDKQTVTITQLPGGSPQTFSAAPTASSFPLILVDGAQYSISVAACQTVATCIVGDFNTFDATGTTRIDATPPSGTVQINDGAVATNNRKVTLNLEATDPLIGGVPGTSSGITQSATDVDGDGTFPCTFFFLPGVTPDTSGCAVNFNPATPATLPAGDGIKTVGVKFGDGARPNTAPCPTGIFCAILLGSPILGNESAVATDTILLDTVKPNALASQDRTTVNRGDQVNFDASSSTDQASVATSGIDLPTATWTWKDGTPNTTGAKVSHVFNQTGTFVGELRVKDRAGNTSDARSFTVSVNGPGGGGASGGSISGISGKAAFTLNRLKLKSRFVNARFRGSIVKRLKGSIVIRGTTTRKGALRLDVRRRAKGRLLARIRAKKLKVGRFTRTLKLPAKLKPGTYKLAFVGPGGTLRFTLKLKR
jgi:PKD domain